MQSGFYYQGNRTCAGSFPDIPAGLPIRQYGGPVVPAYPSTGHRRKGILRGLPDNGRPALKTGATVNALVFNGFSLHDTGSCAAGIKQGSAALLFSVRACGPAAFGYTLRPAHPAP